MSRRAESLADRIEEGAAGLAAFAEGLSEAQWRTPMSGTGKDRRSVGVIVHHDASDQADVTKAAALELLRRNSHQAAAAVRAFTDDELDRAAPFSLSFGAPV